MLTKSLKTLWQRHRYGFLVLVLSWLIFFSRTLFLGQVYFLDDLLAIFYPLEHVYAQFQHAWQLPQWSPLFGFGHPVLAWGQLGFLTPLHVVLRFFSIQPIILLQVSVLAYGAVGLIGMYLFLSRQKISPLAAALGACVFVFSGFQIGHLNHVNFYTATMLLPYLLLAIDFFLTAPSLTKSAWLAVAAGAIALSGQPQVVAYSFIAAAFFAIVKFFTDTTYRQAGWLKTGFFVSLAALLALSLSSLAILPLYEFLPLTERAEDLPVDQLLEFSYPPSHAITLIFPYFFGDHTSYWGAKNFQELAAYTGILPLLLAGLAFLNWKAYRSVRIWATLLIAISVVFSLGRYSPLYYYLVEHHWLTTLNIPGRFVMFFDLGVAVLAAVGLYDLGNLGEQPWYKKIFYISTSILLVVILMSGFLWAATHNPQIFSSWQTFLANNQAELLLAILGGVSLVSIMILFHLSFIQKIYAPLLVVIGVGSLLWFGWSYNPLVPVSFALNISPFISPLKQYESEFSAPARLYSEENILNAASNSVSTKLIGPISPELSLHQPLVIQQATLSCLELVASSPGSKNELLITVRKNISDAPLRTLRKTGDDFTKGQKHLLCFEPISSVKNETLIISFTSQQNSGVWLGARPQELSPLSLLLVRVENPTLATFEQSRKSLHLMIEPSSPHTIAKEALLLGRHLQATAQTSSARWIGALSLKNYRDFIEKFFANDTEVIDGEGTHVIQRYRHILNLSGVTHLSTLSATNQPDTLATDSYELVTTAPFAAGEARLYKNLHAFPKVFVVGNAIFKAAADETRHAMQQANFNPREVVYLNGPKPPTEDQLRLKLLPLHTAAAITSYKPTEVKITVTTNQPAWLVLNDSATPQWQALVDGGLQPYYVANTVFRTTPVPAGQHEIIFRYYSPATELAKWLTLVSLSLIVLIFLFSAVSLLRPKSRLQ